MLFTPQDDRNARVHVDEWIGHKLADPERDHEEVVYNFMLMHMRAMSDQAQDRCEVFSDGYHVAIMRELCRKYLEVTGDE